MGEIITPLCCAFNYTSEQCTAWVCTQQMKCQHAGKALAGLVIYTCKSILEVAVRGTESRSPVFI